MPAFPADGNALAFSTSPFVSTADGQAFTNLDIATAGVAGLTITHDDCVIDTCRIRHDGSPGIVITGARCTVRSVEVENVGAPAVGAEASHEFLNIKAENATAPVIENVTLRNGSGGVFLLNCPGAKLSGIVGYDFRGPYPRGQLVQFNKSDNGLLEDFACFNDRIVSHPEDVINIYDSDDVTVQRGHIDGCNAPSGCGVMVETGSLNAVIEDVDTIRMGNGAFFTYSGSDGATFTRCRTRDQIGLDQGRGKPQSRGWNETDRRNIAPATAGANSSSDVQFLGCLHYNMPGTASYDGPLTETSEQWTANPSGGTSGTIETFDWTEEDFTPRDPWVNTFDWS